MNQWLLLLKAKELIWVAAAGVFTFCQPPPFCPPLPPDDGGLPVVELPPLPDDGGLLVREPLPSPQATMAAIKRITGKTPITEDRESLLVVEIVAQTKRINSAWLSQPITWVPH
jgi:hypothetical protein